MKVCLYICEGVFVYLCVYVCTCFFFVCGSVYVSVCVCVYVCSVCVCFVFVKGFIGVCMSLRI